MDTQLTALTAGPAPTAPMAPMAPPAPSGARALRALLPASELLGRRQRWLLGAGFCVLLAAILANLLHLLFDLGGASWGNALKEPVAAATNVIGAGLVVLRASVERRRRVVWVLVAAALSVYALAFLLWSVWLVHLRQIPSLSVSFFLWEASYPLMLAAIIGAGGRHAQRGTSLKIWLDGLIAAAAIAAIGTAFVLPPIISSAHAAHETVITDLQYPMLDLVVGAVLIAVIGMRGWRLDRRWGLFAAAWVFLFVGDCGWASEVAHGAVTGDSTDLLAYMVVFSCAAAAAWQGDDRRPAARSAHWSTLILPTAFTLTAPAILVYDHFVRVPLFAFVLTMIAFVAASLRAALALRDMLTLGDLRRAALTDDLTDLPNRRMFFSHLREAIAAVQRDGGTVTAIMFDLDNFKQINDTLGHDAGDELLRLAGPRFQGSVGAGDMIARLGGDEFAVVLAPDATPEAAAAVAEAILSSLSEPFRVHGVTLRLTASAGIATFPEHARSAEALLKCIDVAMYEAKHSHDGWERYRPERDQYTPERLELANDLARALERGAIDAQYQPIVDTASRQIVGAEALARWRLPDGSLRPPSEFLHAAELAGLARPLTRRMLDLGLAQVRQWHAAGHRIYVSVNSTVADLLDDSFPDEVTAAVARHGVPPNALVIEVTEGSIVADPERAGAVLDRLHRLGVGIALDDFGTGYSSLTHLRELPVDAVKIDRSFVARMREQSADAAIVYTTIELAHRLGLRAVAEGVEDELTWKLLRELECERIQGYAFSRPVSPEQLLELLAASAPAQVADRRPAPSRPDHLADSQSAPTPASTTSGGSIS